MICHCYPSQHPSEDYTTDNLSTIVSREFSFSFLGNSSSLPLRKLLILRNGKFWPIFKQRIDIHFIPVDNQKNIIVFALIGHKAHKAARIV